jgi:TolB protein
MVAHEKVGMEATTQNGVNQMHWTQIVRGVMVTLLVTFSLLHLVEAQDMASSKDGIQVEVSPSQVTRFVVAIPSALNLGTALDTIGLAEQLGGTLEQSLKISGYFDLLERELYPADPSSEGMSPKFVNWFNSGTQGLIKSSFAIEGDKVRVTLKLFDIDEKKVVSLTGDVDQTTSLPPDPKAIRTHVHRFVNQVIKFYTGSEGFFGTKIAAVRRGARGKSVVLVSADGRNTSTIVKGNKTNLLPHLAKGRVYFTSYRDGGPHLFLYKGGKINKLSARRGLNMGASLSPDGRLLVAVLSYQGSSDLYLLNPDNGEILRRLTRHKSIDISPTWSPDGKQIAFVSDREGSPQLWVMNADGSNKRRLTYQGKYNQSPDWSPKGDMIAYTSRDENFVFDIFTIDPTDPTQVRRLTQNQGNNEEPSFSPDGRHVVFSSTRSGRSELYIMTSDGFTQRKLTQGGGYLTPSWGR